MNHKRKLNLKKQLACIYTADFFSGLRITDAVWVALLAARGFSLWEIGLAESVFHVVSLLCEVPSGMAADLLGRKKTLVSGLMCSTITWMDLKEQFSARHNLLNSSTSCIRKMKKVCH